MTDVIGLLAGGFVLGSFSMRSMLLLRLFAIVSNVFFIAYGLMTGLLPIWLLHAILLPLNCWQGLACTRMRPSSG